MGDRQKNNRLSSVATLYSLGFSAAEIAQAFAISAATVRKDLSAALGVGDTKKSPLRPRGKREVFPVVLRYYAEMVGGGCGFSEEVVPLRIFLAKWLGEEQILDFIEGVEATMDILLAPACPSGKEGYLSLLGSVFNLHWSAGDAGFTPFGRRELWDEYLGEIAEGRVIVLPASCVALKHVLAMRYVATCRAKIQPVLSDAAFAKIDEQLATLTPREKQVIQRRFGIGEKKKDIKGIAQDLDVTQNRVRQIHAKALRKLLHPSRGLKCLIEPLGLALEKRIELERENEQLLRELNAMKEKEEELTKRRPLEDWDGQIELGVCAASVELLLKEVDLFKLSVCTMNCLRNANIYLIGELAMKSENELRRIRNFGRKSRNEVKEVLADLGLRLGLRLSQELKDHIVAARQRLVEDFDEERRRRSAATV